MVTVCRNTLWVVLGLVVIVSLVDAVTVTGDSYEPRIYAPRDHVGRLPGWITTKTKLLPCHMISWDLASDCSVQCHLNLTLWASHNVHVYAITESVWEDMRYWVSGIEYRERTSSLQAGGCMVGPNPLLSPVEPIVWDMVTSSTVQELVFPLRERLYVIVHNPTLRNIDMKFNLFGSALVVADVIVDTHHDTVSEVNTVIQSWARDTFGGNFKGEQYLHDRNANKGGMAIEYTLNVDFTGLYRVQAFNPQGYTDHATDAVWEITYDGGTETVVHNQRSPLGEYITLGTFYFTENTGTLVLRNDHTNGRVVADTVRLQYIRPDDTDSCNPNPCLNLGTCVDGIGTFTCTCFIGFDGKVCEYSIPYPGQYLTNYWVPIEDLLHLGPAANERITGGTTIFTDYLGGEATIIPHETESISVPGGTASPMVWTRQHTTGGIWGAPGLIDYVMYFALAIYTPIPLTGFHIGYRHDDELRIWFDGTMIVDASGNDAGTNKASAGFDMQLGWHQLLFKLHQSTGDTRMAIWFDQPVWWHYEIPP